ncbi:RNA 2'-phosphotransferase [Pseudomonas paralcaligenes]|uniref:RNA 2'-phosphotransferase n=1 Tax=Pseudomonas paralcaligenes TaxID=2772558 RepID=UPI001C801F9D|nr:RNA 2'-phosphotransferase [Pseudomonas paralcaligenes]
MSKCLNEASKFLSFVLRHEPQSIGLVLDSEGWADIDTLITGSSMSGKELSRELIQQIVNASDKKRFSISDDGRRIRAVQGHSTSSVRITYPEKKPPEFLYHGTAARFWASIEREGIKPGERHYVHLSEDKKTAISVGQRYGRAVVLRIKALQMHEQGFKFFQAENGVWLVSNVIVDYVELLSE